MKEIDLKRFAELEAKVAAMEAELSDRLDQLELDQEVLWDDLQKRQKESKPWD